MDQKISQLTLYTSPIGTDVLPIEDVTTINTKKIALSLLATFFSLVTTAVSRTLGTSDLVVLMDATSGVVTATLPTAVGIAGRQYKIKDWKGKSATNNITIATTSAQTIDGSSTKILNSNYSSLTVISDGANWSII